jgi:hypothetical protein
MDIARVRIGKTEEKIVYLEDRCLQTVNFGKSGRGKSSLITNMFFQDSFYPYSKILVDPSGELARACMSLARGKTHYCSLLTPVPLNLLDSGYDIFQISESGRDALNQMITQTSDQNKELTVKMCGIFDRGIKHCVEHQLKSLVNVRDWIVNCQEKGVSEARDGLIQRLNFLLNDERMLPILCGQNGIRLKDLINKGESLILDCKGMGKEKMIFCGAIVAQMIKNYMRYDEPTNPCAVYIDECQHFVGSNFLDTALREGRKYKLAILLSTQQFAGMDNDLIHTMLGVGNIISFQVPYREATYLSKEMDIKPQDLQFIEKWHAAYMTPDERGILKVSRPPFTPKWEPKAEPKKKSDWFPLVSCQP